MYVLLSLRVLSLHLSGRDEGSDLDGCAATLHPHGGSLRSGYQGHCGLRRHPRNLGDLEAE